MHRTLLGAALAAGLCAAQAATPLQNALVHGIFKPATGATAEGAVHPLPPQQRLDAMPDRTTFRIAAQDGALSFPALAAPGGGPADLSDIGEGGETFLAPVDLTGSGVSDLIYTRQGAPGWKILTNAARLPSPAQGFVAGLYGKGSDTRASEVIPADTRDLAVDQDLLAATGDFLGNGTEQVAYTRPGQHQLWIVGAHGVTTMKADLRGVEPTPPGARTHWLFSYRANRKGQRTRLAYYRAGSDHLVRLVPKGMEFQQEQVPLKGHWERLNQAVMDWPRPVSAPEAKEPTGK